VDSLFIHGGRASVAPTKFPVMCIQNRVTRCPVGARLVRPMNFQTASYYNPPFTSFDQRLEDMRVTDSFLGITALRQPVINSIKTSYTYAWGSSVKVFKRIKFGTIIWYQVGTSGSTAPQGWIPVVYTAPNFLTSYFIGTPPNTAPCNFFRSITR